jgi:hypothetical protein
VIRVQRGSGAADTPAELGGAADLDVVVVSGRLGRQDRGACAAGARIELPFNLGIGGALQAGFRAPKREYERHSSSTRRPARSA